MGIICKKVVERYESGAIKVYGGTYELEDVEAIEGIKSGEYIAEGLTDGQLPDGVVAKKKVAKDEKPVAAVEDEAEAKEDVGN